MPHIACLHTADSNAEPFDAALRELEPTGVTLSHIVRADLLVAAETAGGLTPTIAEQTAEASRGVCAGAVLLTCSTLGPAAEAAAGAGPVPLLRVDAALAREAVADGGKVAVLCAVETTVEPTRCSGPQSKCGGHEIVGGSCPHSGETDGGALPTLFARCPRSGSWPLLVKPESVICPGLPSVETVCSAGTRRGWMPESVATEHLG